jgi:hypothetical protein
VVVIGYFAMGDGRKAAKGMNEWIMNRIDTRTTSDYHYTVKAASLKQP